MARLPRLTLPGYPHHVIQRGNNRQAIFAKTADYQRLLDLLDDNARQFEVAIHAYVLMSNHFHLLVTPQTSDGLPQMMQAVGRRYVRYFNDSQQRSGTLWEGRYRSTLIQTDRYLLACMAYIDLNPVRAGLVAQAADYPWTSHGHYIGRQMDKVVTPHPLVWALGNTPFAREAAYAELVQAGINPVQQSALTQERTQRRVAKGQAGRPQAGKNL